MNERKFHMAMFKMLSLENFQSNKIIMCTNNSCCFENKNNILSKTVSYFEDDFGRGDVGFEVMEILYIKNDVCIGVHEKGLEKHPQQ